MQEGREAETWVRSDATLPKGGAGLQLCTSGVDHGKLGAPLCLLFARASRSACDPLSPRLICPERTTCLQICFPREDFGTLLTILADALKLPESEEGHADAAGEGTGSSEGSCEVPAETNCVAAVPASLAGVSAAFAREFNAVTRHVLGVGPEERDKGVRSPYPTPSSVQSARADLQAIAASGRSAGWFVKLASIAVALLSEGDKGVTRAVWARAAEMLAPDPHAQALRSLSVTQVRRGGSHGRGPRLGGRRRIVPRS